MNNKNKDNYKGLDLHCKFLYQFIIKDGKMCENDNLCPSCGKNAGMEIMRGRIGYGKTVGEAEILKCSACYSKITLDNSQIRMIGDQELTMLEQLKKDKHCKTPCPAHCENK